MYEFPLGDSDLPSVNACGGGWSNMLPILTHTKYVNKIVLGMGTDGDINIEATRYLIAVN